MDSLFQEEEPTNGDIGAWRDNKSKHNKHVAKCLSRTNEQMNNSNQLSLSSTNSE